MMRLNHGKRLPYLSPQLFYGKKEYAEKNIKRTIKLKFSFSSRIQKKVVAEIKRWSVYSYFEKGCRKKCTRQSRKVLWVILSSLFFKEISKNGRIGHGRMFASAKGKKQKQVRQLQCQEQCIDHIPYYLSGLSSAHFFRQPFSKQLYINWSGSRV